MALHFGRSKKNLSGRAKSLSPSCWHGAKESFKSQGFLGLKVRKTTPPDGFSIVYALVIGFGAILLASALSSRTFYSVFGASFSQDTRRARDAAELGSARILSELNRERNRQLLATVPAGQIWNSTEANNNPNLCAVNSRVTGINRPFIGDLQSISTGGATGTTAFPSSSSPVGPVVYISSSGVASSSNSFTISQNSPNLEPYAYQLERITVPVLASWSRGGSPSRGEFQLKVRGYSFNNGRLVGSTSIEQTIEVVPKCCNLSFGGNAQSALGNDSRNCNAQITNPSFGFLFGTGLSNDASITITGVRSSVENLTNGDPVSPLICQGSTTSTCPTTATVGTTSVSVVKTTNSIDPPQQYADAGITAPANPPAAPFDYFSSVLDNDSNCVPNTNFIQACREGSGGSAADVRVINAATADLTSLPSNCGTREDSISEKRSDGTSITRNFTSIHCNVTALNNGNREIYRFITSDDRRLVLHFPNEDSGDSQAILINGDMQHCDSSTSSGCNDETSVTANPLLRLNLLGCKKTSNASGCIDSRPAGENNLTNNSNMQTITLRGNSTAATQPFFLYAPEGKIVVSGGGGAADQLRGMFWVNEVSGSGNVEIAIPGSGIGDILNQYTDNLGSTSSGEGPGTTPFFFEYMARAVRQFRLLPGQ